MSQTVQTSAFDSFIHSLRNEKTKHVYGKAIIRIFRSPEATEDFVKLAARDRRQAEAFVINWLDRTRSEKISGSTTRTYLAALKSFCDFVELPEALNWKKVVKSAPKHSKSQDRPTSLEEIRRIFSPADTRFKFIIALMESSGIRVGSFDFFSWKDLEPVTVEDFSQGHFNAKTLTIGKLRVYAGESEQYFTFVSSECMQLREAYREERERSGEVITSDSPLVRNPLNFKDRKAGLAIPSKTASTNVTSQLRYAWKRQGLEGQDFKACHGLRKHFKTSLENAGMKSITCEALMGHLSSLDSSYYRPTPEQLAAEYAKFQSALFINPALSLQDEKDKILVEARSAISSESGRVQTLEKKLEVMNQTINDLSRMLAEYKAQKEEKS